MQYIPPQPSPEYETANTTVTAVNTFGTAQATSEGTEVAVTEQVRPPDTPVVEVGRYGLGKPKRVIIRGKVTRGGKD